MSHKECLRNINQQKTPSSFETDKQLPEFNSLEYDIRYPQNQIILATSRLLSISKTDAENAIVLGSFNDFCKHAHYIRQLLDAYSYLHFSRSLGLQLSPYTIGQPLVSFPTSLELEQALLKVNGKGYPVVWVKLPILSGKAIGSQISSELPIRFLQAVGVLNENGSIENLADNHTLSAFSCPKNTFSSRLLSDARFSFSDSTVAQNLVEMFLPLDVFLQQRLPQPNPRFQKK